MAVNKPTRLVQGLLDETNKGAVKWEETAKKDTYQVSFPEYSVQVTAEMVWDSEVDADVQVVVIQIFDHEGSIVDRIYSWNLEGVRSEQKLVEHLYDSARRVALGVDKAYDYILSELGILPDAEMDADSIPF